MISYIKPRRKRRMLSVGVHSPSSRRVKSDDSSAKPAVAEMTGRHTSASIMSRYWHLDRQRSQCRRMSGRRSSADDGSRPSTRSQTVALMHRQLVMARMKPVEETEIQPHLAEPPSESCSSYDPKRTSSNHHQHDAQTAAVQQKLSVERSPRRATVRVKKEASEAEESERSMRRFIRRRNFDTSGANKGEFILLKEVQRLSVVQCKPIIGCLLSCLCWSGRRNLSWGPSNKKCVGPITAEFQHENYSKPGWCRCMCNAKRESIYNHRWIWLRAWLTWTDGRGSGGRRRRRARTTCADRLRAPAKDKGAARRLAYGGRPSHNRA